ncbi:MAG: GIY-YIG nuclease family protein [Candidatus Magasanikbacteria bacterium]|nr:GIY-YIG nuclease family protein [Candidatus Magasanikbacteria bacterium]USN52506.1 MAG: GIY-YIG nuclease family protein [Candidatus Nomurabacteria bacterium]
MKRGYTYILSSESRVLYIGITNNIERRLAEHRAPHVGFSDKYQCHSLVFLEEYDLVIDAIAREKQLKKWRREKKVALILKQNPEWKDLLPATDPSTPPSSSVGVTGRSS